MRRASSTTFLLVCLAGTSSVLAASPPPPAVPRIEIADPPAQALAGVETDLSFRVHAPPGEPDGAGTRIVLRAGDIVLAETEAGPGEHILRFRPLPGSVTYRLGLEGADAGVAFTLRGLPGWISLLPPLLAILLALVFRQIVPALFAGVWLGGWIAYGSAGAGLLRALDTYLVGALADADHASILIFSMLLGGMVGVLSRSGGLHGLVERLAGGATDRRRGQVTAWLMGLVVFFDDYANTLVVGNTLRPVTDRLRISREKLAYIVDSTAAPVASIALVSTWIGFEVSLIADALTQAGMDTDAYTLFLQSIPYRFYPILTLAFGFLVAWWGRDFGPMARAEARARTGRVLRDGALPLADFDHADLRPIEGAPRRWTDAALPILAVLLVTFAAQVATGRAALAEAGDALGRAGWWEMGLRGFGRVFAEGNSFRALLYGSAAGCVLAILLPRLRGVLRVDQALRAWLEGMKTMVMAFVILTLAWSIGQVCEDLHTADFMVSLLTGRLDPRWLPVMIFLFSAAVSFATGSSWSTMSILVPLAVPSAIGVARAAGLDAGGVQHILVGSVSSVLAGSIFGDHCSPLSDTTILSSMASACDHVDHVRTQLPYAVVVALVGMIVGDVATAWGLPVWIALALGAGILAAVLWIFGRRPGEAET